MTLPNDEQANQERAQTDESLRVEREKADHALAETLAAIEETADVVINRARERADEVLAKARAKTDAASHGHAKPPTSVAKERSTADALLERERAAADETLRVERAETVALLAVERSETDQDLLEERVHSDEALATRDEFLGVVSHDLRNMLSSMIGFAALINAEAQRDPTNLLQIATHARRIERSGGRMNRLIGDLVDVASIEAGTLAVTRELGDTGQVAAEALDNFQAQATTAGIALVAEIVEPVGQCEFDPARILQVLTNLLSNAIKFTPRGGSVVLRVERVENDIVFSVSDTGMGIPADQLEAVFQRFLQVTKNDRRGLGLGLYISRCIMSGHGGRIWAESKVGAGSKICFTIPASASS